MAHLIRTARSLAERQHAELAACGAWALAELQRLCHMATAPPTGGEWRAWYARLCKLIDQYHDRPDDAGRFARRLLREMDSLWVFLAQHGVEPTNNRAERALRFGVLWRKRSLGTASDKGNRWVERILSLKETCGLRAGSTYQVLVDAVTSFFTGQQPASRLAPVAPPPHMRCGHGARCRCTRGAARMPTRRHATATERSAPSRAVVKKSAPVGPDCALVLSAASRPALALSYWDLWFALVADADFEGSWERFVEHTCGRKRPRGWDVTWPSAS